MAVSSMVNAQFRASITCGIPFISTPGIVPLNAKRRSSTNMIREEATGGLLSSYSPPRTRRAQRNRLAFLCALRVLGGQSLLGGYASGVVHCQLGLLRHPAAGVDLLQH